MKIFLLLLVVVTAPLVSADELPLTTILTQSFNLGVITDTFSLYNATLQVRKSANFAESLRGAATLRCSAEITDDSCQDTDVRVEVDLLDAVASRKGTLSIFFTDADEANISLPFDFKSLDASLEATGMYTTNRISYGTYWWRFTTENEFFLQLVDHIFTNTTTIHGFAKPMSEDASRKPWWQNWGLVLVTIGVFLIKMWLGALEGRRALKREKLAAAAKKKAN